MRAKRLEKSTPYLNDERLVVIVVIGLSTLKGRHAGFLFFAACGWLLWRRGGLVLPESTTKQIKSVMPTKTTCTKVNNQI